MDATKNVKFGMTLDEREELLKEIRDNYQYAYDMWKDTHDEGATDMRFISGDPWDPKEKEERRKNNRPCLALDELGQYVNRLIAVAIKNKRAIKIDPAGEGATSGTAALRAARIRQIEYESDAQDAQITAFENACQRSYGYWRINTEYVSSNVESSLDPALFNQQIKVRRIPNPDTILFDPDCKEANWSDAGYCFELDSITRKKFRKDWPDADVIDFSSELAASAPQWIKPDRIQVAGYWKVEGEDTKIYLSEDGEVTSDPTEDIKRSNKTRTRIVKRSKVTQYMTNGVEILEVNPWAGRWIPIVPVVGKELYVDRGSGTKRELLSLIRLARDPYMLYCYYRTCEAELVGMTPKTPYFVYEGQVVDMQKLQMINQVPQAAIVVKATLEGVAGVLPFPQRQPYDPALQSIEAAAESARRAIQAAMGISALPTPLQQQNQKSGVALERVEASEDQGSSHFINHLERSIAFSGRIINDLLSKIEDNPREAGVRSPTDQHSMAVVGQEAYGSENHAVTVTTGPSYASQRDMAADFIDLLVKNMNTLPLPPGVATQILALAIRMKEIGPIGDEMANLISPQDPLTPEQAKAQLAQAKAVIQQLQGQVQQMGQEKLAKVLELKNQMDIEHMKETTRLTIEQGRQTVQVAVAEITSKAQMASERLKYENAVWRQTHESAHQVGLSEQEHQQSLVQQQQVAQQQLQQDQQSQPEQPGQQAPDQGAA